MELILKYFTALWQLILEMSPYLLLGFVMAGLLKVYLPADFLTRYMGRSNKLGPVNAALIGVPLPLCSCGVLPAGLSLEKNGAGKGSAVSFLISTPQTGLDSIMVTYAMLGLPFALLRPVIAFITGIAGGYATNATDNEAGSAKTTIDTHAVSFDKRSKLKRFFDYTFDEFLRDILNWLIIGLLLAALITIAIPDNFFASITGKGLLPMLIVLLGSVPLYVCATASVPIAAVLLLKGLSPGAALVFLMAGPATNAATITVLKKALGNKTTIVYLVSIIIGAMGFGWLIDTFLPSEWFSIHHIHNHNHEILPAWLVYSSAAFLIVAAVRIYSLKIIRFIKEKQLTKIKMETVVLNVEGMGCAMCSGKIEKKVGEMAGVALVKADFATNRVDVSGEAIDVQKIADAITELGYTYKGLK